MKDKINGFIVFMFSNFGPLVIFFVVNHFMGLKSALAVSTAFSIIEIGWKLYHRQPITGLFKFTAIVILLFGAVDLYAQQSFLFRYEAAVTNIFTAVFFGYSLFSQKTVIQEFYEKKGNPKPMTRDRIAYFRLLTGVWVLYFLAKAGAYYWVAQNYSIEKGLVVRTVIGSGSFYVMIVISTFGSKYIFPIVKQIGLIPEAEEIAASGR